MSTTQGPLLAVGRIVKPIGVRGDVIVQPMTEAPSRFRTLRAAWLGRDDRSVAAVQIERASVAPRGVRLKIKGIDDRAAAEGLRASLLFVDEKQRIRLPRGRYFVHEIIGLLVRNEQGNDLGKIADVLHYPAHDVYVVRGEKGEILIPAVKEFVRKIDVEGGTMTVRLIEGMVG